MGNCPLRKVIRGFPQGRQDHELVPQLDVVIPVDVADSAEVRKWSGGPCLHCWHKLMRTRSSAPRGSSRKCIASQQGTS